jgi:hypothetical protein
MRTRDSALRKNSPLYGPDRFTFLSESNRYRCPAGQQLTYGGRNARNRTYIPYIYIGTRKRCGACSQKAQRIRAPLKYLAIHMQETARQQARDLANTLSFANPGPLGMDPRARRQPVHYISLAVAGQNYAIDSYYTAEQKWYAEEATSLFRSMETTRSSRTVFGWTR